MEDLEDVALTALDAAEAADQNTETPPDAPEAPAEGDKGDNAPSNDNNTPNDAPEAPAEGDKGDAPAEGTEKSGEGEDAPAEKGTEGEEKGDQPKKPEMSDEEFEKLAKERGYFKQQPQQTERPPLRLHRPEEIDEKVWGNMDDDRRLIYTRLPYITVRGMGGDDTEPQIYKIKTPEQLPDDFKFASDKEKALFDDALATQSRRADALDAAIRQFHQNETQQKESRMVVAAIDDLQAKGIIPKIVAKNGTKEFDTDPGVVAANRVLAFWKQRNDAGARMSIEDAALIYKSTHPDEFKSAAPVAKGDAERKGVASKIGGGSKSADTATNRKGYQRKYWKPGMTTEEVAEAAMADLD